MARGSQEGFIQAEALAIIVQGFASCGTIETLREAAEVARAIRYRRCHARAIRYVARGFAAQDRVAEAVELARAIPGEREQIRAMAWIASGLADCGQFEEALKRLRAIVIERYQADVLTNLARSLAEQRLDLLPEAVEIACGLQNPVLQTRALSGMSRSLATSQRLDVQGESLRIARLLRHVALTYADAGSQP